MSRCQLLTYEDVEEILDDIVKQIGDTKYSAIICVVRGGMIPSRMLADMLRIKHIWLIDVKEIQVQEHHEMLVELVIDKPIGKVLVVDDNAISFRSLIAIAHKLEKHNVDYDVAILWTREKSQIPFDKIYCGLKIPDEICLMMPWEKNEHCEHK